MTAQKKNNTATSPSGSKSILSTLAMPVVALALFWGSASHATTVQFQTVMGDFEVNLFDETTPETVANFLSYVADDAYNNSFIHRVMPGFVAQGGGFVWVDGGALDIPALAPVINEPVYSNLRGTIAMAKLGTDANSATSQWFFNLDDNSGNLDNQNGGFTVFGQVVGDGMDIVDAIAALQIISAQSAVFSDLPVRDYDGGADIIEDNLAIVSSIQVLDAAVDTAADLSPVLNTSSPATPTPTPTPAPSNSSGGGGGGSAGLLFIALMSLFAFAPLRRKLLG